MAQLYCILQLQTLTSETSFVIRRCILHNLRWTVYAVYSLLLYVLRFLPVPWFKLTYTSACRSTDWKAGALKVRVHIRMKFPVVVTLLMFIKSILESIHRWSIYHMLKQLVLEIDYSVAVEMLLNIESDIWFIQFQTVTT